MIDVQMRAHHVVDVIDRETRSRQRAQIDAIGLHIPFRARPWLVVSDAAVDQNGVMWRLNDIGLKHRISTSFSSIALAWRIHGLFSANRSAVKPGSISSAGRNVVSCSMMR
jgi:hypothetical protein